MNSLVCKLANIDTSIHCLPFQFQCCPYQSNPTQMPQYPPCTVFPNAVPELPVIEPSKSVSEFSVLVSVQAPSLSDNANHLKRAPIDLVLVLDVSGSMTGDKTTLLKSAVRFIIDNMSPSDRLAIVAFSSEAKRIFPLQKISDLGSKDATRAVDSLSAGGSTNILKGLTEGVRVFEERDRSEWNSVQSIFFLSDGQDTDNVKQTTRPLLGQVPEYLSQLPNCIYPKQGQQQTETIPVHSFGLGLDHDSTTMNAISNASGGTYSSLESATILQRAFATCIGGLLSVVVRELQLTLTPASPGVQIVSVSSGRYPHEISQEGKKGVINVGDLYADEKKDFLVRLTVPASNNAGETSACFEEKTPLLDTTCSYKDFATNQTIQVKCDTVEIRRPKMITSLLDTTINLEVDRQKNRVLVAQGMEEAISLADVGKISKAQGLLIDKISTVRSSPSGKAEDAFCNSLVADMEEILQKMGSMEMYEKTGGRRLLLAGLSSHSGQKVTTRCYGLGGGLAVANSYYSTPAINRMVYKSQN